MWKHGLARRDQIMQCAMIADSVANYTASAHMIA
jgi:hypothetical protein